MADFTGTSGNDSQTGTSSSDTFDYSQGGQDTLIGGGGAEDDYLFGSTFGAGDMVIGTAGTQDIVFLDGDYSGGVTFSVGQLQNVDMVYLDFAEPFSLKLTDGAGGVNGMLDFYATSPTRLNASAVVQVGIGLDARVNGQTFFGGAGDDVVHLSVADDHSNALDGGAGGSDHLYLDNADNNLVLHAQDMKNFEILTLAGKVATVDANVAAGQTLQVFAENVPVEFDGHRETDGVFQITGGSDYDTLIGGRGADTISGGEGNDIITGGKGADLLSGGDGHDTFVYQALGDSTGRAFDTITDLDSSDTIDLSAIDARTDKAGDQAFRLVDHFDGQAGELTVTYKHRDGFTLVQGDVDGDGKADLVIHLTGDQSGFAGFVL